MKARSGSPLWADRAARSFVAVAVSWIGVNETEMLGCFLVKAAATGFTGGIDGSCSHTVRWTEPVELPPEPPPEAELLALELCVELEPHASRIAPAMAAAATAPVLLSRLRRERGGVAAGRSICRPRGSWPSLPVLTRLRSPCLMTYPIPSLYR